jgi:hypothetical protein
MFAFQGRADMLFALSHFRFYPKAGITPAPQRKVSGTPRNKCPTSAF